MTASGDFIPPNEGGLDGSSAPVVFGIRLTPTVLAVLAVIAGLAGAGYIFLNLVQPTLEKSQQLQEEVNTKEQQLVDQAEIQRQINQAKTNLAKAKQLNADVRTLFASEAGLDTLLLDINARVQAVNAGIQDPKRRATLSKFDLDPVASVLVTDGSLGAEMNNRIDQRVYNVEMKGNFVQTESIIRNIERLQPLLVVQDLKSELDTSTQSLRLTPQGRVAPTGQPETRITTSFKLVALIPEPTTPAATPNPSSAPASPPNP
jgi:type IV pilus assembly protein PilO